MRHFEFDQTTVDEVAAFHGHLCGGIATGIKAAELAMKNLGDVTRDEDLTAVVETDMCAVDAIQVITGCSFGKGNLLHRDWGKNAYTFYNRRSGRAIRIAPRPSDWEGSAELQALRTKRNDGTLTREDSTRLAALQEERIRVVLASAPEELFLLEEVEGDPPPRQRSHATVTCEECGEPVGETRMRWLGGRKLCPPCFQRQYALV